MITSHKKYELYGCTFIEKLVIESPFQFLRPMDDNACFIYMLKGDIQYQIDQESVEIPTQHSLLLNCINFGIPLINTHVQGTNEIVIIHFHPDILKKIYDREFPALLMEGQSIVSNKSAQKLNNDFLIQKYIEGFLFYFDNPNMVNDDMLILKLKEIILLLLQTHNAEGVQVILSRLFSKVTYSFKQIIDAHLFAPLTVQELAAQNNLSVSSFKREFAKIYNDTPANYIKTKRLEKAAQMLLLTDQRISDVAFECGFSDIAHFTKSFHSQYQVSPTQYRLNQIDK